MGNINFYSVFNLATLIGSLGIFFFVIYLQFKETYGRPVDYITPLRKRILIVFVICIVASLPSIVYQYARSIGLDSENLRNLVTITSGIFRVAISLQMLTIWTYRGKPK